MKEILKSILQLARENKKLTATLLLYIALFLVNRYAPLAQDLKELLMFIGFATGLYGTGFVPSFAKPAKGEVALVTEEDEPKAPPP